MLTVRQRRFVRALATAKSHTEAAVLAGYALSSARVSASRLLRNSQICQEVTGMMQNYGLRDEDIIRYLKTAVESGLGKRATTADAINGIKLYFNILGYLPS